METTVAQVVLKDCETPITYDTTRCAYTWMDDDHPTPARYEAGTLAEAHTMMLYADVRRAVLGSLRGRGLNPSDAEDAFQEGIMAVWIAFGNEIALGEAHTRSWYKTRAVRYAKTWLRDNVYKYNRERETELTTGIGDVAMGSVYQWHAVESQIAISELANKVRKSGSPRRAMIIIALAYAGRKIDAAKLLEISGQAVSDHLPDIRAAVSEFLLS